MTSWNTSDFLDRLLRARTTAGVEALLSSLPIVSPDEYQWDYGEKRLGVWRPGHLHWVPVGLERGNGGRIKLAGEPMNPLAERLVNGMEAVIELGRLLELLKNPSAPMPPTPRAAVLRYFGLPPLDEIEQFDAEERKQLRERVNELRKMLVIQLDHDRRSKEFAVTIRDKGTGQLPSRMHSTLLSLGHSDKPDKPYLIGVFGQGGASAFSASEYSVIVTRRAPEILSPEDNAGAGWSIVRAIHPKHRRDVYYAYLAASEEGAVPSVDAATADKARFPRGTHFCHIKYDFGGSESAVTRLLYQALNHVLFNPVLPYDLYALKEKPEPMLGTAQRLARRARLLEGQALDKSFAAQSVA
jgi:hypothetical protein